MRVVDDGSALSGVEVRMVIQSVDASLFGSVMGPTKLAPASRVIVSPGRAALIAFWRSSPALTVTVFAPDCPVVTVLRLCAKVIKRQTTNNAARSSRLKPLGNLRKMLTGIRPLSLML